jgi:hypothetical protein
MIEGIRQSKNVLPAVTLTRQYQFEYMRPPSVSKLYNASLAEDSAFSFRHYSNFH